ncbi:MAG: hypothetical protein DRQ37_08580, partial [Gammaproteobacteria bacterium]
PLDIPEQKIRGRVHRLEQLSDDIHVLTVRTQRGRTLRFFAGQRTHLIVDGVGELTAPLANCPCDGFNLQFHLSRSMDGASVERLLPGLRKGLPVEIEGPYGDFTLDDRATRPVVFIAEGTGFAPIGSLIEHAVNAELERPMRLYWFAARPDGHYRLNYCRAWSDAVDGFDYRALVSETTDGAPASAQVISLAMLPELVVDEAAEITACDLYVAGSRKLIDAARSAFTGAGLASEQLFLEVLPAGQPD